MEAHSQAVEEGMKAVAGGRKHYIAVGLGVVAGSLLAQLSRDLLENTAVHYKSI